MKRHIVRDMTLREISSVDRPAQVGAVSVLIKRAEDPAVAMLKASFQEALDGRLIDQNVQKAFYQAFDNLWTGQDAFRKALSDELRAGGDGSTASDAYKAWIGDLIDKAVSGAKDAGAGSKAEAALVKAFETTLTKAAAARSAQKETIMTIRNKAELKQAIEKALADGDALTVGTVTAIHKAAADLKAEDELPATGPLAKAATGADPDLAAKVARMEKRDALPADLRKHYDGLADDAARDAFLAKSADDQKAELSKGLGDDPVVYTTLDGTDIRKSAGDAVVAMAKRLDDQSRQLAKAQASAEDVELEKRATTDLGNIGGELLGKKALLKAVDGIADAKTKDAALAVLKAANTVGAGAFRKRGSGEEGQPTAEGPAGYEMTESEAKLEDMAKAHAKEHQVTFEKAYAEVIQTEEGSQLYRKLLAGD